MTKGLEESDKINNEGIKKEYGDKKLHGYFPFRIGQGEFTAQIEPVETSSKLWGFYKMLLARRADADTINTASMKQLEEFLALECEIFDVLELIIFPDKEYDDFLAKLAGTLPNKKANKRAFEVERLFYSASFAADSVAEDNFSSLMRADSGRKKAENEIKRNPYFLASFEMQKRARAVHEQLQDDSEEKATEIAYHLQASLKSQISSFAMASALLVMYGADDSNDFVSHMIRNARNAAIRNMNECAKANIPCIAAICDFEMAESVNGNAKSDFNVLMAYWRASLYAKALLMSFK